LLLLLFLLPAARKKKKLLLLLLLLRHLRLSRLLFQALLLLQKSPRSNSEAIFSLKSLRGFPQAFLYPAFGRG